MEKLSYLICVRVSDTFIKLLALQDQIVVARLDDPALGGYGPGSVDVVSSHHPDCYARSLALLDGTWYFVSHWILHKLISDKKCYKKMFADEKNSKV